jgi:hypothetical protein
MSIGSAPSARRLSYSNVAAATVPRMPPATAVNATVPAPTLIPRRPPVVAKVNTVAGTTIEPNKIMEGRKLGFCVASSVRSNSKYAPMPASKTQSQLSRYRMCGWAASRVAASGVTGRVAPVVEAASGGSELWGDIHPLSGELRAVPQNSNATWTAGLLRVMTGRRRIRRRGAVAVGHHFAAERFAVIAHEWPGLFERTVYRSACGTLAFHLRQSPCRTTITVWSTRAGRFVSLLADRALHFVTADLIVRVINRRCRRQRR